jgi:hypothetical protein
VVKEKFRPPLTQESRRAGHLNEGMIAAMSEVGRLFEEGNIVPEMLIARAPCDRLLTQPI